MSEKVSSYNSKGEHGKDGSGKANLMTRIEQAMKGFHGLNAIAYKHKNEYVTYSRPADCLKFIQDSDVEFVHDRKEIWPVLNNMQSNLPITHLKRRPNRVNDTHYTVPPSDRQPIIPEPVFPQSKGLKLRPIDEIMNDGKLLGKKMTPSSATAGKSNSTSTRAKTVNSSSTKPKAAAAYDNPTSKIQGVLDIITSSNSGGHGNNSKSSTPYANSTPTKINNGSGSRSKDSNGSNKSMKPTTLSTSTSNRPRKSSLLKSEITNSKSEEPTAPTQTHQFGSKKPMSSLTNTTTINRPRISSKSTSSQKNKYTKDIPDLIEARSYLIGDIDELEFKKLEHLVEPIYNTQNMKRPVLLLHIKAPSPALKKVAQKHTPAKAIPPSSSAVSTNTTNTKTVKKEETSNINVNKKINATTPAPPQPEEASPSKVKTENTIKENNNNNTTSTKSSSKASLSTPAQASAIKKSLSDRPPKSIKTEEKPPPIAYSATSTPPPTTDKQAYPSSNPAAFLRSMKIPKRKNSDIELEEGETISPSPSPHHSSITSTITPPLPPPPSAPTSLTAAVATLPLIKVESNTSSSSRKSRNSSSNNEDKSNEIAATPVAAPASSSVVATPVPVAAESTSSSKKHSSSGSSRRDEERSSSSRRSDRYHDDRRSSTTKHRSSRYNRSRSRSKSPKSRSRSPTRSHRSESRSKTSTRRQTSSESSSRRRRASPPPAPRSSGNDKRKNPDSKYDTDSTSSKRQKSEKDSREKYTSSSTSKRVTSPPPAPQRQSSTSTTASTTDKILSATAPNAETLEQYKVFQFMFSKLAHANKRRGDTQQDAILGMIDHFYAICNYILNFYYSDKHTINPNMKQSTAAWKSIFPFCDSLTKKLESRKEHELCGLCIRLVALIRFYMYSRMESSTRSILLQQMKSSGDEEKKMTDRTCVELSENLLHEYEKAEKAFKDSERHMNYSTLVTQYPETFKNVCMEGNLLAGITLGGEAGVSVSPMFPFAPYSPLHHAAIATKCILAEYVAKNNLKYTPISKLEEFM